MSVSQFSPSVNGSGVLYELDRQDVREALDHAGRWAWTVYDKVVAALGDYTLAAKTANLVYEKVLVKELGR